MCVTIVFKAESKPNTEEEINILVGKKNTQKTHKNAFSRIQLVVLCLLFNVKGSIMQIFTKNINIEAPWNFFKMKILTQVRKFGFGFGNVPTSVRSKK